MANKTIGPKIKRIRQSEGLTQEQLAKSLGYSGKSVIAHIEKGDADMTYEKICLLLKTYKLDSNELFDVDKKVEKKEVKKQAAPEVKEDNVKRAVIYIHGQHGSAKEASDYSFLKDYDVVGLEYPNGTPWEVGPVIKDKFKELIKPYDEVIVIAVSLGAFYTYEYLADFKIKRAFFISPVVSMFQTIVDMMVMYDVKDKELKEKRFIELEDGRVLSYDFYQHVSNEEDHWTVPTDILYGAYDEIVYTGSMMEFLENHPLARLTVKSDSEHHFASKEEKAFIKDWIKRMLAK